MKNNVLYISYDGLSDNLGQSQILPYLIKISESNFKFHLITCDKQEKLSKRRTHLENLTENAGICWSYIPYHKSPPILSTWYDLNKIYLKAQDIILRNDIKIIHCRSYPAMSVGLKLKRKFGIRLIFDMRGFYPEERVEGGIWNMKNPIHRMVYNNIKKKEFRYLKDSDAIVSLTTSGKMDLIGRNLNLNETLIWVVPCAADYEHFQVLDGIEKNNEIVYLGSIGTWYLLDEMLLFFKTFLEHHPDWKLRFITPDSAPQIYEKAKKYGIPKEQIVVGACFREEIPRELNKAKASLFFIKPTYSKTASYPTKMAESLACGLPVICNENVGDINIFAEKFPFVRAIGLKQKDFSITSEEFDDWLKFAPEEISSSTEDVCGLDFAVNEYLKIYNTLLD